jgi:TonB family protein
VLSAEATLQVSVDAEGNPMRAQVLSSTGYDVGQTAAQCAMQSRYAPPLDGSGRPVPGRVAIRIHFQRPPPAPRGTIVELAPNDFRLDYYDASEPDSHLAFLQQRGFQGGGASWEGIAYGLLELESPETLSAVHFDPEADGLAVWSPSRDALLKVSHLIARAKDDPQLLQSAIDAAIADGRME